MKVRSASWAGHRIGKGGELAVKRWTTDSGQAITRPREGRVQSTIGHRQSAIGGQCWKKNEYEGKSHDIVDNKGPIFLSHDVYDK
jgi:hypothetical protein